MQQRPSLRIERRAAERLAAGHVWVYTSDVDRPDNARPGDTVTVLDPRGVPIGTAHFSAASQIALRLFSHQVEPLDEAFFRSRLQSAIAHRARAVRDSNACRLVFSEADRLPGLIVDRYGDTLVLQTLTQGMDRAQPLIVKLLDELLRPCGIWERNDATVRTKEQLPFRAGPVLGAPSPAVDVVMNGVTFNADLAAGQKTGVYLDQRENYLAAARWAHGEALDCFTSTGGFALHMASTCTSVEAVDSSANALAAAERNRLRNNMENVRFQEADIFDLLSAHRVAGRRFQTIVLDPPAFAKTRSSMDGAARGYKEINLRALQLLPPGGVLVTCSCSHHMSEEMLLGAVLAAARDTRRSLRLLERRTQASDHPILPAIPETLYLKCLILEVL
ncbi:MAG: class I SAM-dependent rRNA methyltransferase [Bryobacterales bacterium]|nr:class I SAM-dependent rRNA methyltransferase [Bryobacterales bacterium]